MKLKEKLKKIGFEWFDLDQSSGNNLYSDSEGNVIEVIIEYEEN